MLAADAIAVVVLLVDLHLFVEARDVGDVDLDGAVAQGLHELVVQELLVLGLVGVADDDLVDVGLRELLRLDLVLLRGAEEVVQEGDVELEHLDELDDAAVGDVELAVEVEGARIGVRAVLGDLAVVDVASELGRVLVLLVLGLEGADADAVLLGEDDALDLDVAHDLGPVTLVVQHQLAEDLPAGRIQIALDEDRVLIVAEAEIFECLGAPVGGNEAQWIFVHRRGEDFVSAGDVRQLLGHVPVVGVERAVVGARILLEALLEQASDGRFRRADRTVQEDHALLGAVALSRRLEDVDQLHERDVEAVNGVAPTMLLVLEEVVADQLLLVVDVLFLPVRQHHVVDALERRSRDLRVLSYDGEIILERARPVQLLVLAVVLKGRDPRGQVHHRLLGGCTGIIARENQVARGDSVR